jgi:EmrB/QacA subfamily drug resistance transporter
MAPADVRPPADSASAKWAVFALVSVGTFMTTLDSSIVNIAVPAIAGSFGTPVGGPIEWVVIAYLVAIAATLLSFSRLADLHGRERVWLAGLAVFTGGSVLSGLAPSLILLIAARAVQGIGASLIFAPALALIFDVFPVGQRGQALGLNALVVSLGTTAGPTLGGLITESLGWRWIFFVNLPLGLIGLVLARRVFAFRAATDGRRFDIAGATALGLSLAGLSLGLSFGSEWGWTSPALVLTLSASLGAFVAAVVVERRRRDPVVDFGLLISRQLGLPLASFLFSILALFAVGFLLPLYSEELRGLTPLAAGLLMTPYSLGLAVASPISGRLADRGRARWLGPLGLGLAATGLIVLAGVGVQTALPSIAIWLTVSGVGQGLFLSPNTRDVMSAVPRERSGEASGLIATTRVVGQTLSVAIAGALFVGLGGAAAGARLVSGGGSTAGGAPALDGTFLTALHAALLVSGLLAAAGALVSLAERLLASDELEAVREDVDRVDRAGRADEEAVAGRTPEADVGDRVGHPDRADQVATGLVTANAVAGARPDVAGLVEAEPVEQTRGAIGEDLAA